MLVASAPPLFPIPFANNASGAYINTIPQASQIGITPGAASLYDGFPPLNFVNPLSGGVPFFGKDVNGILNEITANIQWEQAGGVAKYNAGFSSAIGGYPNNAVLLRADGTGFWRSTVDNNTSDPDTGGANWYSLAGTLLSTGSFGGSTRSGYLIHETGFILNWGLVITSGAGTATVTLPQHFPTACFGVLAQGAEYTTPFNGCVSAGQAGGASLTQVTICSTTAASGSTPAAGAVNCYWWAYGY